MTLVEFGVRISYYEHLHSESSDAPTGFVGSMLKDDFKAVVLPRVGEYWMHTIPWLAQDLIKIDAIEHAFRPRWISKSADPVTANESEPWVTAVIYHRAFGQGEAAQIIREFEYNGWRFDGDIA